MRTCGKGSGDSLWSMTIYLVNSASCPLCYLYSNPVKCNGKINLYFAASDLAASDLATSDLAASDLAASRSFWLL